METSRPRIAQLKKFWVLIAPHKKFYLLGVIALLVVDVLNVGLPLILKKAIDAFALKDYPTIVGLAGAYFAAMAIQGVGRYYWRIYLIGSANRIASSLRKIFFDHYLHLPLLTYQKFSSGDFMSRSTNDVEMIRTAVGPGVLIALDAIVLSLLILPTMFVLSWKLSLVALCCYPLVPFITRKLGKHIDALSETLSTRTSQLSGFVQENISSIRVLKSLVLGNFLSKRFEQQTEEYYLEAKKLAFTQASFTPSLNLLSEVGTLFIFLWGGFEVINGKMSLGTFVAFQRFLAQLAWPMEAMGWVVTMFKEGAASYRRMEEILLLPKIKEGTLSAPKSNPNIPLLEIKYLKYKIPGAAFELNIDHLVLNPNEKVAIIGSVGSGKTTLFHLLMKLYCPPQGAIFFKGEDISELSEAALRSKVCMVEQPVFLFGESIEENLYLRNPQEIKQWLQFSEVHDELEKLPKRFETQLGEKGLNLSGGQKQRMGIARALAQHPELILLDDAFSAIDTATEERIIQNLKNHSNGFTLLFSTHRLKVLPLMDRVIILEGGKISADGHPDLLLSASPVYRAYWDKGPAIL